MRLVIENCRAYTSFNPPRIATRLEIEDGVISSLDGGGASSHILDLGGRAVIPALTDSHIHLVELATQGDLLDLRTVGSKAEMLRRVATAGKSGFVYGYGWDQEKMDAIPTAEELEAASGGRPVLLERVCGHVGVASLSTLKLLGRRPSDGTSGLVVEDDLEKLREYIPKPGPDHIITGLQLIQRELLRYGLTRLHVIVRDRIHLEALDLLASSGDQDILCYITPDLIPYVAKTHNVRIQGVKVFVDGSLGGWTAALRQPYADKPVRGVLRHGREDIRNILELCSVNGLQPAFHAIGDEAISVVLDAIEEFGGFERTRIEHASLMDDEMIRRAARLGVILSIQPMFAVSDTWLDKRLGDRVRMCYRFRSMLSMGCVLCGGSDAPVEPANPFRGIWAAVYGNPSIRERLEIWQALEIYSSGAAYASGDEKRWGRIAPGYTADLIVLDRDPLGLDPVSLKSLRPVMTIRRGRVVASL